MAWMNVVNPFAIAPRRRVVATALMYGLSLSVRFTSAAGEEAELPAHAVQTASPVSSIIFYKDWPAKPAPLRPSNAARLWDPEAVERHVNAPCRRR